MGGYWATPGVAQILLLDLCSRVTAGSTQASLGSARDQTGVSYVQGKWFNPYSNLYNSQ